MLSFDEFAPDYPDFPGGVDGMPMAGPNPGAIFGIFGFIVVIAVVISLVVKAMNVSKVVESGNNPLTFETDLAIKAMQSQTLAPEKSTASRLAELDALLAAGTISAEEHAAARVKVLGDV